MLRTNQTGFSILYHLNVFGWISETKRNVSFPLFTIFGLPSKCKKGNDNYTLLLPLYYSNFGELIALDVFKINRFLPLMLLSINATKMFFVLSYSYFWRKPWGVSMRINHFIAFVIAQFLLFDRFSFRSVCNLLSFKIG